MSSQDPTITDPDKYRVVFENDKVRVLDYQDKPGDITKEHYHRPFVLTAITAFKRKIRFPDGKSVVREFKPGENIWSDEQVHIGENIGTMPTHAIIVELK